MRNADVEELFERVQVGDTVVLAVERTEEVARIFGGAPAVALTAVARAASAREPIAEASGDGGPELRATSSGQQQ
jgi:hypothetical protein